MDNNLISSEHRHDDFLKFWCCLLQCKDGFYDHTDAYNDTEFAQSLQHNVDSVHSFTTLAQGKRCTLNTNQNGSCNEGVLCVFCRVRTLQVNLCAQPCENDQNANHWNLCCYTRCKIDHALDLFQTLLNLSFNPHLPCLVIGSSVPPPTLLSWPSESSLRRGCRPSQTN